jgi:RNA polymerase sigma-70 factor (ECF subfamily)
MTARIGLDPQALMMETERSYVAEPLTFEDFYVREYPTLYALATALAGVNQGEDLAHDALYKTLLHWKRVRAMDRPGGWCHRVLLNVCRSFWRRHKVEANYLRYLTTERYAAPGPSTDVVAFWAATRKLPSRPRMVVALYYAADHSTADVAAILAVPEGTVRSDLARARVVLAEELRS